MAPKAAFKALKPTVALGVAAHPDDLDFMASGTFATWAAAGTDVYYLILTNGNKGSDDPTIDPKTLTETRRQEQRDAAKLLGVKEVFFLDYEDGCLEVNRDVKCDIARVIRTVKPEVVITFDPGLLYMAERGMINHPDHRAAGQATLDAVYPLARDCLSLPELYTDEHLEPHKVRTVLLSNFEKQNFAVDITAAIDTKIAALKAHVSQIPDTVAMAQFIRDFAAQAGQQAGCKYAEGFIRIDVMPR